MKNIIYFAVYLASIFYSCGQNIPVETVMKIEKKNPWKLLNENNIRGLYLKSFLEVQNNFEYIKDSSTHLEKSSYYDVLVQLYNYFGEYKKAAESEERFLEEINVINGTKRSDKPLAEHISMDSLKRITAIKAIQEIAGNKQIIIINEEHRATVHREMTLEMLPVLYKKGFRYLAVETLATMRDTLINTRKYPTSVSGYYTNDPVFGEMIRRALSIGYKVLGYDFAHELGYLKNIKSQHPMARDNIRDSIAARMIIDSILKKDPEGKIIVHAGRAHAGKFNIEGVAMLAWHFREYSGINPFSIDQVSMSGFNNTADQHYIYNYVQSKYAFDNPVVFQKENGTYWSLEEEYDMCIFTPPLDYQREYPSWLHRSGKRKLVKIKYDRLGLLVENSQFGGKHPLIIEVKYSGESKLAIPAQQILLSPHEVTKEHFLLFKGNYEILLKNEEGQTLGQYSERVK